MLIDIQNLSISIKNKPLIQQASLHINEGEWIALIGPSGCGKTTLAKAILNLQPNFHISGKIFFQDTNLLSLSESQMQQIRGGKIAMIFQEPLSALNPLQTISTQILESLKLHKQTTTKQHVLELLQQVELQNPKRIAKSYPHQLSGGERQRAMIAMALAGKPQLLIADEPTTALDTHTQTQILTLLKNLQKELNLAILFITHDLSLISKTANRVYVMENGKILANPTLSSIQFGTPVLPPKGTPLILDVQKLTIRYGKNLVVKDFNLQLYQGETLALVGPSGSGKSSIGQALVRLIHASGHVILEGQNFLSLKGKTLKNARSKIQMVFQDPFSSLNPRWMIKDIILEGGRIHNIANLQELLELTLKQVHLKGEILTRYPHELSGGQRVRVALARALILKPKILILDEITTQLDVHIQSEILNLLKELQQKYRLSYIFITHDQRALQALAHRSISILSQGLSVSQNS